MSGLDTICRFIDGIQADAAAALELFDQGIPDMAQDRLKRSIDGFLALASGAGRVAAELRQTGFVAEAAHAEAVAVRCRRMVRQGGNVLAAMQGRPASPAVSPDVAAHFRSYREMVGIEGDVAGGLDELTRITI